MPNVEMCAVYKALFSAVWPRPYENTKEKITDMIIGGRKTI
jgi:hypothetical protein